VELCRLEGRDESEQSVASIFFCQDEAAGPSKVLVPMYQIHDVTPQKIIILILIAIRTPRGRFIHPSGCCVAIRTGWILLWV